jgi:hypothetical protein
MRTAALTTATSDEPVQVVGEFTVNARARRASVAAAPSCAPLAFERARSDNASSIVDSVG